MGILISYQRLEDDQLRVSFVACQVVALLLSLVFRYVLSAGRVGVTARHVFAAAVGMYMAYFCHRWQVIHFLTQSTVCYIIILSSKPSNMHKYVFLFSMLYLTLCHIYRTYYNFGTYTLDFTGPLMIMTQKVTSLTCALHDGLYRDDSSLSADQRKQAVRPLEYYSYVFYFPEVLAIDFNPFPPTDDLIIAAPLLTRFGYLHLSIMMARTKYYFAWSLADAVANAAGLGFNGYDENGNPRWDLISNLNILKIEFATSLKMLIDNWNIQTSLWLKRVCYDRAPSQPVLMVYVLSAMWHGFYPGYYFTFLGGAVMTPAFRKMRHHLRHHFQGTARLRQLYDVITFTSTHFFLNYTVLPFVLLDWEPTMKFYRSLYFSIHIIVLLVTVLLPYKKQPQPQYAATKTNGVRTDTNGMVGDHTGCNGTKINNNKVENGDIHVGHQGQNGTWSETFCLRERMLNGMKGFGVPEHNGISVTPNHVEKKVK
ncbi:lysophospholipid acyltransferase 2-like [Branchiostoma floridae]|uniref:Lysophospholipid acyltransferase 2-like n=1 Tax=Branchiostoma floridae TaxID=7739 RepID=A0A9J7HIR0_BRAFL|nr:lysophospholipid acyltransferase 2-like [Branchiostoma floridae]